MISIIIPVYNVAAYLSQCLDSLINQTYRDIEIICVDDGSTDESPHILADYAEKDSRIQIIRQENRGLSGARNVGIERAQGEWMMFVDSDDWIEKTCCQQVTDVISSDLDLVFFSYIREFREVSKPQYIFDQKGRSFAGRNTGWLYQRLIAPVGNELKHPEKIDSLSTAWGKLYRTSIIKEHKLEFVDTKQIGTEDLLFNVYYFSYIKKAVYVPSPMYHYRKYNEKSLTSTYKPRLVEQWELLFDLIEKCIVPLYRDDLLTALQNRRALCLIGVGLNIVSSSKSFFGQYRELSLFLKKAWYRVAIKELDLSQLPFHWYSFFFFAKHQSVFGVYILLNIIRKMISRG